MDTYPFDRVTARLRAHFKSKDAPFCAAPQEEDVIKVSKLDIHGVARPGGRHYTYLSSEFVAAVFVDNDVTNLLMMGYILTGFSMAGSILAAKAGMPHFFLALDQLRAPLFQT